MTEYSCYFYDFLSSQPTLLTIQPVKTWTRVVQRYCLYVKETVCRILELVQFEIEGYLYHQLGQGTLYQRKCLWSINNVKYKPYRHKQPALWTVDSVSLTDPSKAEILVPSTASMTDHYKLTDANTNYYCL